MPAATLRDFFSGPVIGSVDPEYEDARHVYNFMIEAAPTPSSAAPGTCRPWRRTPSPPARVPEG
jgi:hypothetical protein